MKLYKPYLLFGLALVFGGLSLYAQSDDPGFWVDPFTSDPPEEPANPNLWDDPFYLEQTELTLPQTGMPSNLAALRDAGNILTIHVERNLLGGMYNTLCLPFDVESLEGTPLEGCEIVAFSDAELKDDVLEIYFERVSSIEAGIPYLIYPPANIISPMDFTECTIKAVEGTTVDGESASFIGTLDPFKVPADNRSLCVGTNNTLFYVDGTTAMYGMRAYFYVSATVNQTPARLFIGPRGTATEIMVTPIQVNSVQKYIIEGRVVIRINNKYYTIEGKQQ